MRINNVPRTCKLMTAALKDLTRKAAHHLVVNLILLYRTCKRRESTCVGNRRIREKQKQMEVLEMAERESRNWFVFGKICDECVWVTAMCVSDCIQKINVLGLLLLLGVRSLHDQGRSGDEWRRLLQLLPAAVEFGRQGSADRPHVFSCGFVKGASL